MGERFICGCLLAEKAIDQSYAIPELAGMKTTARCARTLCRVDFQTDTLAGDPREAVNLMMSRPPWEKGAGFVNVDPSGKSVYFLAREGYELPQGGSSGS